MFLKIGWIGKHFGEEPPLVGSKDQGAGGVFFSGCHMRCVFCQNYQISQQGLGKTYSIEEFVEELLRLEREGAINIDLVTPTIWYRQIKIALCSARKRGLTLPIVWNSNGYEEISLLHEMEGFVDIYLPDFKYGIDEVGERYSKIRQYSKIALNAIKEMERQVGYLKTFDNIAYRGLIVRHLILPNNLENSFRALEMLADFDLNIHLSLLSQFYPTNKANNYNEINRILTSEEARDVFNYAEKLGFYRGWRQELDSPLVMLPDFTEMKPFEVKLKIKN